MSLLLELNVPTEQLEETLDTLAALSFAISPTIRQAPGRRAVIEFPIHAYGRLEQVENALLGRGLLEARTQILEEACV
jgi:hypothetical protein